MLGAGRFFAALSRLALRLAGVAVDHEPDAEEVLLSEA